MFIFNMFFKSFDMFLVFVRKAIRKNKENLRRKPIVI